MTIFVAFAIGILIGSLMGSIGMLLLIKETGLDLISEDEKPVTFIQYSERSAPELEPEDNLEMPQEVKYGDF